MMPAILGLLMAILEVYAWLFRPNSHASPNAITIGLPIVIAGGIVKRPANERPAILTFAAMLAVSLNRGVIAPQLLVHFLVLAGAVYLTWWSHRERGSNRGALKRLGIAAAFTLGGFVVVWLWQIM